MSSLSANTRLDSLFNVYRQTETKTKKLANLLAFTFELRYTNVDSTLKWLRIAYEDAIALKNEVLQAEVALQFAGCEEYRSNYAAALKYDLLAANLFTRNKNKQGLAKCYVSMGVIYWYQGMYTQAQDYFKKNIALSNELGDFEGMATSFGNLAIIYDELGRLDSSLHYYNKALDLYLKVGNRSQLGSCYDNMSLIFLQKKDFEKAIEYHSKGFEIRKQIADTMGIMASMENLGTIYIKQKKPDAAIEISNQVLAIARRFNAREDVKYALINLKDAYEMKNDIHKAYMIQEELMSLKDSLRNLENMNHIAELEARFKNKEQEAELGEIKLQQKLVEQENESNHRRKNFWIIILVISGVSFLLISSLVFRRYKEKQRVADELEKKNEAIKSQKHIIDTAYAELAEINKDITDSIRYAKRIQEAIFPDNEKVKNNLPESFVLFLPKDIVSGDFYWVEKSGDSVYFALVDCTGHGVPGAFMSIVGENLLNKALFEFKLNSPAAILNQINSGLAETLKQNNDFNSVNDGMEVSLIKWDKKKNEIIFAGANHVIYQVTDGNLIIHKGDKFPIEASSFSQQQRQFNDVKIPFKKGDMFYFSSDGYSDQFGGSKGKKFKKQQLAEQFLKVSELNLEQQKNELLNTFNNWKGNLEQLDDVLVIGLRM